MDTVDDVDAVPAGIGRESNIELKNSEHDSDLTELKSFPAALRRNKTVMTVKQNHIILCRKKKMFCSLHKDCPGGPGNAQGAAEEKEEKDEKKVRIPMKNAAVSGIIISLCSFGCRRQRRQKKRGNNGDQDHKNSRSETDASGR